MEALYKYFIDRYTPAELVEHIDVPMEVLVDALSNWLAENRENFQEDFEYIYANDFEALNEPG
jgi:hypothetical protein